MYDDLSRKIIKYYYVESKTTKIIKHEWNKAPSGDFIPTLIIEPLELEGSKVNRVASGGLDNIKKLGLGIGAIIKVAKSGSIIPAIMEVIEPSYEIQEVCCKSCGQPLTKSGNGLRCKNLECKTVYSAFIKKLKQKIVKHYDLKIEVNDEYELEDELKPYSDSMINPLIILDVLRLPRLQKKKLKGIQKGLLNIHNYEDLDKFFMNKLSKTQKSIWKIYKPIVEKLFNLYEKKEEDNNE